MHNSIKAGKAEGMLLLEISRLVEFSWAGRADLFV